MASRAHGVVDRAELLAAGLTPEEIRRRMDRGALIRVHRGVYRVGHRAPSTEATYMAAVKAGGPGTLLSGEAAAHLLEIRKGPAPPPEITTPTERRIPGVKTRRSPRICRTDATRWKGIPTTTVPRTLIDLAAHLSLDDLARAFHEASIRHGTQPHYVERILRRDPGAAHLRAVLRGDADVLLSGLEREFKRLLTQAGLPLPITNRPAGTKRVDCRWPDHHLTVELDSYRFHASRHAWEHDRRREREAYARGDDFRRFTHGDVFDHPRPMLQELSEIFYTLTQISS